MRRDWAVGLILTGMFLALSWQGGWIYPMMAGAPLSPFLAAAVSVLLNRFCEQMGGGENTRVIRFIIAYVATRCVIDLVFAVNRTWAPMAKLAKLGVAITGRKSTSHNRIVELSVFRVEHEEFPHSITSIPAL